MVHFPACHVWLPEGTWGISGKLWEIYGKCVGNVVTYGKYPLVNLQKTYGKSPSFSSVNQLFLWAMFNCCVSSPEGNDPMFFFKWTWENPSKTNDWMIAVPNFGWSEIPNLSTSPTMVTLPSGSWPGAKDANVKAGNKRKNKYINCKCDLNLIPNVFLSPNHKLSFHPLKPPATNI